MTDRIVLHNMRFEASHGYYEQERQSRQPFEVDVELELDVEPAGSADELERTVDYAAVYAVVRDVLEGPPVRLLETLAESISGRVLAGFDVAAATVRVRKPGVDLGGPLDYAGVEIRRTRR